MHVYSNNIFAFEIRVIHRVGIHTSHASSPTGTPYDGNNNNNIIYLFLNQKTLSEFNIFFSAFRRPRPV